MNANSIYLIDICDKIGSLTALPKINEGEESDDSGVEPTVSRYSFLKGALYGKIVTEEDWKVLSNNIVYQIQTDTAVLALGTVSGLLGKRTFPQALTGTLQGAEIYVEGKAIDVSDY